MQFTIGSPITRCTGLNHVRIPISILNGPSGTVEFNITEFTERSASTLDEAKELVMHRIRSAMLEADAVTFAQRRTALETKTFEV